MTTPGWLQISAEGISAGLTASAITYTLVSLTASAAATGTGLVVDAAGSVAASATRYFFGEVPAMTVRVLGRMGSTTGEESVQRGGKMVAIGTAVVVGGTTIAVTVGTRVLHATVHYGGALTKEIATRVATAYLKYRAQTVEQQQQQQQAEQSMDAVWGEDGEWTLISEASKGTVLSKIESESSSALTTNGLHSPP